MLESSVKKRRKVSGILNGKKARITDIIKVNDAEDEQSGDPKHIQQLVDSAAAMEGSADIPALCDTTWVDVVLLDGSDK